MSDVLRELLRTYPSGAYQHDRLIRDFFAEVRSGIRDAATSLWGSTPPSEVVVRAISRGLEDALPSRDGILAAIRAGVADGAERALAQPSQPLPEHPILGRRARHPDVGTVESVQAAAHGLVAVVRRDDGSAWTGLTREITLWPETP